MERPGGAPAQLSDSLHRRLSAYALAAAGVGLAIAPPAEAKIVYTKTHHRIHYGNSFNLDLNHDGMVDFVLQVDVQDSLAGLYVQNANRSGNGIWTSNRGSWAAALPAGVRIGPNGARPPKSVYGFLMDRSNNLYGKSCISVGNWVNAKNRYLGLAFQIKGKTHYGWARLTAPAPCHTRGGTQATLTGYAYETIPGKAIITGQTEGSDGNALQPASLGRLAQGSVGLVAWRSGK
jgi:hypothetical protein